MIIDIDGMERGRPVEVVKKENTDKVQTKDSFALAWMVSNLGVIVLVAVALYLTSSLWSFIGLLFLFGLKTSTIETKCPKCNFKFTAVKEDKEDEY